MRPASRTAPRNSQLCRQRLVGGGEAKSGVQGDLQEPAGDLSLVGPPKPLRWVRPVLREPWQGPEEALPQTPSA